MGLPRTGDAVQYNAGASVATYCGIGIDNTGAMMYSGSPPDGFPNGVPCFNGNGGGMCAVTYAARTLPTNFQGGLLYDATGRIVTVNAVSRVLPLNYQNGFTFDANGALLTT
jgi:hypothetical protein